MRQRQLIQLPDQQNHPSPQQYQSGYWSYDEEENCPSPEAENQDYGQQSDRGQQQQQLPEATNSETGQYSFQAGGSSNGEQFSQAEQPDNDHQSVQLADNESCGQQYFDYDNQHYTLKQNYNHNSYDDNDYNCDDLNYEHPDYPDLEDFGYGDDWF